MSRAKLLAKENVRDIYPLSPMQEGMLFHALMDAGSASYFQQTAFRVAGQFDVPSVEQALDLLVARHDVLRTVFKHSGAELPLQIVLKEWPADFRYEDLSGLADGAQKEEYVRRFKEADRARTFDLTRDALMRVSLLRLADDAYEFVWSNHHILMDGWCVGTLVAEFFEIYYARRDGQPYQLPEPRPYSDYIKWLGRCDKEAARDFWRQYLEGFTERVSFPTQRPARQAGYLRERVTFVLGAELTAGLRQLANSRRVTLFQVVESVWGLMLSKYAGAADVVFGSVVSGRPAEIEGVEQMIGLFINTIPVRIRFEPEDAFTDTLAQVKAGSLAGEDHSYFPLNEIQAVSGVRQGLFDHILVFHNLPPALRPEVHEGRATASLAGVDKFEQTSFDLCVDISVGDALTFDLTYNGHVHERAFIERTARVLERVAEQVLERPEARFREVSLLAEPDRELLARFNATERRFPLDRSIVRVFEEVAAAKPDATAVVYGEKAVSYGELNARANRLARHLLAQASLGADDRVALLMERSDVMLESILAVWKAGAAYMPVDPAYPAPRVVTMVADSGAGLVLTDAGADDDALLEELSTVTRVIRLDRAAGEVAAQTHADLNIPFDPSSLAYVIYTSGSTGAPKGVMVEHVGMLNHLYAKINDLQLGATSVVAQNASHCFDISVWQFFAALMVGGSTVVYDTDLVMNPERLLTRVASDGINILEVVPSYLSVLFSTADEGTLRQAFRGLRYLLVTGEPIKPALAARWFGLFDSVPLVNAYGPTEASDDITHHLMRAAPEGETVPIGAPLPNFKIYIADDYMNLCPVGVKGEILVSGLGVGRGYLNDEAKTKRSFTEDPFRPERGVRLYKTGDLGRYREDGRIEFFGRKDNQVKVRGFRIELEEIEHAVTLHPLVEEAAVVVREAEAGDAYLCGFVVAREGFEADALRAFLEEKLPRFMVPTQFAVLSAMPLTPNGKLDRKALALMPVAAEERGAAAEQREPSGETEEKLVRLWQEVLGVERVGVHDNFFDLGGDSFKAIRVASKFGRGFLVPDLYKYPTVERLAAFIAQKGSSESSYLYELTPPRARPKYAVVAVPNSAGDPLIYREAARELAELDDGYVFYGVSLPRLEPGPGETMHSMMQSLVGEIAAEIKKSVKVPVILYGQCNGSGLALQIAQRVEEEGLPCKAVCMSAQLPLRRPVAEQDKRTDEEVVKFLRSLSATFPDSPEDRLIFIRNFRYDGTVAKVSYNESLRLMREKSYRRLTSPLFCIAGDQDPLMNNYHRRYRDWEMYAENVSLVEVKDVGHFIWRDRPAELARIIHEIGEDRIETTNTPKPSGIFSKVSDLLRHRAGSGQTTSASGD
jgi:amino acid adenylation domain-containing protein